MIITENEKQKSDENRSTLKLLCIHYNNLIKNNTPSEELTSIRNKVKKIIGVDQSLKIPDKALLDTLKRKSCDTIVEIPDDRIEKTDLEDIEDILGLNWEDLFKHE
jgi:hypothetical protein